MGLLVWATALGSAVAQPEASPGWGILVPAYFYPAGAGLRQWEQLLEAAKRHPEVPIAAVVNPASGPGERPDPNYQNLVRRLHRRVVLLGYVATGYGQRASQQVRRDVDRWLEFYPGIRGFFFDEQSRQLEHLERYACWANYARARLPGALIVSNPGTSLPLEFARWRTADVFCIYEGAEVPQYLHQPQWTHLPAGAVPAVLWHQRSFRQGTTQWSRIALPPKAWIFCTDAGPPNPWNRLPSYWWELVRWIQQSNHSKSP